VQGAWDNYIANNSAMDPNVAMWPMNLDLDSMGAVGGEQGMANGGAAPSANPGNVFMGSAGAGNGGGMM